jgi:succinate-semialdehyde dehydrogenase/glutarate-semialdehyde dehydrogenase
VFDDADLDAAVEGAMVAKMRHSAEVCTAANRFYAEAGIAADFTAALAEAMSKVTVGNGLEPGVTCGPMINPEAIKSIGGLVDAAVSSGATVATGGGTIDGPGYFYQPTVLGQVDPSSPITKHEIFGPVAPVISFTDHDEMIVNANATEMGLAAYVYTGDLSRGLQVSERLESGMVALNRGTMSDPAAPFGGMKQSGLGREGASEGIYEFCETQLIATNW